MNIPFTGYYWWKVNIWESMLAVAIFLVTCIWMATSLVGIIPDLNEDDVMGWFQTYKYLLYSFARHS